MVRGLNARVWNASTDVVTRVPDHRYSSTMKAAVRARYGPPEAVRIAEVPTPTPHDHQVLVRVHATTVNRTDCGFRAGKPFIVRFFAGLPRPRRTILGTEFAGVVEAIGAGVTTFEVGDRVFGFREWSFGAHAEYIGMPEDGSLATIPEGLSFEQAAPSTEGSHYALSQIRKVGIRRGNTVLVYGATGAIGSAAVQILKHLGVTVTAVCATAHVELVKGLGADRVIDYTAEDFTRDADRYDVVFDAVGKSSFGRCRPLLKSRGIYLSRDLGPYSMNPVLSHTTPRFRGKRVRFPIPPKHSQAEVREVREMIASGAFRPVIDRTYPLEQIVEAYQYVETGQKIGNVVITVGPASGI
jgi:NADPH:quinone reductase-like Zn-dependent oxidoreductase